MNFGKIKLLSSSIVYGCDSYESDLSFDSSGNEYIPSFTLVAEIEFNGISGHIALQNEFCMNGLTVVDNTHECSYDLLIMDDDDGYSDLFDHLKKEFIEQEKEMIDVLKNEGSK